MHIDRLQISKALAFFLGLFHLLDIAGIYPLSTQDVRIVHLTMALTILFLSVPTLGRWSDRKLDKGVGVLLVLASLAGGLFILLRWREIALSGGLTNRADALVGFMVLLLVLEGARRRVGTVLALITLVFFLYPLLSSHLPGLLYGRGYSLERMAELLTTTSEGIYGIPLGVSASYIILFTIFGAFLSEFGAGEFFFSLASRITSGMRAAAAKTAVLFSALVGMVSGSAAGNVAVTGTLTIPMMKREGYAPHQAGAIEAVASTGGQIMPPVMGAAAFIMAELIGIPYVEIMWAGLLPALLFFVSIFFVVHLQGLKRGLVRSRPADTAAVSIWRLLFSGMPHMAAFFSLIGMIASGYSPFKACFVSILLLCAADILRRRGIDRDFLTRAVRAITAGAQAVVPIAVACAAAGMIAGVLAFTGLGPKISAIIIAIAGGVPLAALLLTMLLAIVLGMGLPTTAAYLILATVVAPALVKIGVPILAAHMFVFYYGCISTITPPVALASYVAAGIAGAEINKTGWTAFLYGLTSYILPFLFFYGPPILLQGGAFEIAWAAVSGFAGTFCIAAGVVGYLLGSLAFWSRVLLVVAGIAMMNPGVWTDLFGVVAVAIVGAAMLARKRLRASVPARTTTL